MTHVLNRPSSRIFVATFLVRRVLTFGREVKALIVVAKLRSSCFLALSLVRLSGLHDLARDCVPETINCKKPRASSNPCLTWRHNVATLGDMLSPSPGTPDLPPLSPSQQAIMEIIWRRGELTAREVLSELNGASAEKPLARGTVRRLIDRMKEKGWIKHRAEGRTHFYSAVVARQVTLAQQVGDLIERFCEGRPEHLVATLLDQRSLTSDGLQVIRKLLDEAEQKQAKGSNHD